MERNKENRARFGVVALAAALVLILTVALVPAIVSGSGQKGALNGDGKVNSRDVIVIMKYTTGWTDVNIDSDAADFNGDGRLNSRDIIALMKFILEGTQPSDTTKPPKDSYELPFIPLS